MSRVRGSVDGKLLKGDIKSRGVLFKLAPQDSDGGRQGDQISREGDEKFDQIPRVGDSH